MGKLPSAAAVKRFARTEREWWERTYRAECAALGVDAAPITEALYQLSPRAAAQQGVSYAVEQTTGA